MSESMELETLKVVRNNNNDSDLQTIEVIPGNGHCTISVESAANENSQLLPPAQVAENNREQPEVDGVNGGSDSPTGTSRFRRELKSLKTSLNEEVVWKLRLWMVILLVILVITLIIGISVIVCEVLDDDGDDNYDKSSFVVDRFFRGSFTLDNSSFTSNSLDQEVVLKQLEEQLREVYSSSPALERYFSTVTINHLQNTTAQFKLQFVMPSEHEELVLHTMSLKMVKNVLRQYFYDQDPRKQPYVIPTSLSMEVGT